MAEKEVPKTAAQSENRTKVIDGQAADERSRLAALQPAACASVGSARLTWRASSALRRASEATTSLGQVSGFSPCSAHSCSITTCTRKLDREVQRQGGRGGGEGAMHMVKTAGSKQDARHQGHGTPCRLRPPLFLPDAQQPCAPINP